MSDMAIPEGGFHNLQGKKPIVIKKDAIGSVEEYDTELPGPCLQTAVVNLDVGQKITKRVGALSSLHEQESRNEVLVKKQRKTPKVKRSRKRKNKGLLTRRKSHKDILKQKWSESGTYYQGTLCKLVPIATKETNKLPVQVTNDVSSVGQMQSQAGSDKEDTDSTNGKNIDQEKLMDTGQSTRPSSCCSLGITKLSLGDSKQNQINNGNKKQTKTIILHTTDFVKDLLQKVAASACYAAAPGIQQTFTQSNAVSVTHTVKSAKRQDSRIVYPDKPQDKLKTAVASSQAKAYTCNFATHKTDSLAVAVTQAIPTLSDVEPTLANEILEAIEAPIPNFHALEQCGKDGMIGKSNFKCTQSIMKSYLNKKHK